MSHESSVFISSIIEEWPEDELTPQGKAAFLSRLKALPVGWSAKARAILHWEMQTREKISPLERARAIGYSPGSVAKSERILEEGQ
jgi:hypothetical protein